MQNLKKISISKAIFSIFVNKEKYGHNSYFSKHQSWFLMATHIDILVSNQMHRL